MGHQGNALVCGQRLYCGSQIYHGFFVQIPEHHPSVPDTIMSFLDHMDSDVDLTLYARWASLLPLVRPPPLLLLARGDLATTYWAFDLSI